MDIKRTQKSFASEAIKTIPITRIWANDGWCYIPELKLRQKFFHIEQDVFRLINETYDGITPFSQHSELLTYILYSNSPLAWAEQDSWGIESYAQIDAIHHINNQ